MRTTSFLLLAAHVNALLYTTVTPRPTPAQPASASIAVERLQALKAAGGLPGVVAAEKLKQQSRVRAPEMRSRRVRMTATPADDADISDSQADDSPPTPAAAEPSAASGLPSWLPLKRDDADANEVVTPPPVELTEENGGKFFAVMDKASNVFIALFFVYIVFTVAGFNPLIR